MFEVENPAATADGVVLEDDYDRDMIPTGLTDPLWKVGKPGFVGLSGAAGLALPGFCSYLIYTANGVPVRTFYDQFWIIADQGLYIKIGIIGPQGNGGVITDNIVESHTRLPGRIVKRLRGLHAHTASVCRIKATGGYPNALVLIAVPLLGIKGSLKTALAGRE